MKYFNIRWKLLINVSIHILPVVVCSSFTGSKCNNSNEISIRKMQKKKKYITRKGVKAISKKSHIISHNRQTSAFAVGWPNDDNFQNTSDLQGGQTYLRASPTFPNVFIMFRAGEWSTYRVVPVSVFRLLSPLDT